MSSSSMSFSFSSSMSTSYTQLLSPLRDNSSTWLDNSSPPSGHQDPRHTVRPSFIHPDRHPQGTVIRIFESGAEPDTLRLLVGNLPSAITAPARQPPSSTTISLPLSPHYARLLAALAHQRGFDGYLLNFECPLRGGAEQTRVLAAWIALLRFELVRSVGEHAECIWCVS
jgi:mannosyl-glycoprotein endo-beta-N-acetylglucosaminidase